MRYLLAVSHSFCFFLSIYCQFIYPESLFFLCSQVTKLSQHENVRQYRSRVGGLCLFSCHKVINTGLKAKLKFVLQKIYEVLSANQIVKAAQSDLFHIRLKKSRKRLIHQRFFPKLQNCLFIPAMTPNTIVFYSSFSCTKAN